MTPTSHLAILLGTVACAATAAIYFPRRNASAPADGVAETRPQSRVMASNLWLQTITGPLSMRLLNATGKRVGTLRSVFVVHAETLERWINESEAAFLRAIAGEIELTIGDPCDGCVDVHVEGTRCPRAMVAFCFECSPWLIESLDANVDLTFAGWCVIGGRDHEIGTRMPK